MRANASIPDGKQEDSSRGLRKKLFIGLIVMACLTPLGIILPKMFNAGEPWGEWGPEHLQKTVGYIPEGLKKTADIWRAPLADYKLFGKNAGGATDLVSYVVSGLVGILLAALCVFLVVKLLRKGKHGT